MGKFTEKDTEEYYDSEEEIYLHVWDKEGLCHWGVFLDDKEDHLAAMNNLTDIMAKKAELNSSSNVLDLGCGDGEVDFQLARKYKCNITGVDLSGVHIHNAKNKLEKNQELKKHLKFIKASATKLPFEDEVFSHVWIQSTLYHVHDKEKALSEIYRVLKKGGFFVFDDLTKPKKKISRDTEKYLYERLLFDTDFSFDSYQKQLIKTGFHVIEAHDFSPHYKKTYEKVREVMKKKIENNENPEFHERYKYLIKAYKISAQAVDNNEVGWALFLCKK